MPYKKRGELPKAVRDVLPADAQDIWLGAYNEAAKKWSGNESRCASYAWGAVGKAFKRSATGKWEKKSGESDAPEGTYEAIRDGLRAALDKSGLFAKSPNSYFYLQYVYPDSIIVCYDKSTPTGMVTTYWQVPYTSDGHGGYAFGKMAEVQVEHTTTIEPADGPGAESAAVPTVTLFGLKLTRGAAFESAEIVAPDAAELHTGCMVEDARHDPDKGDYHLRICEAGANERKRRIYPNETIESADLSLYDGRKMYLNHDREAEEKGEVRRVEDLAAVVKSPWLVKASEAGTAGAAAIDAIAHVFPNAPHGFAQNMRDVEFRKAVAASHVFRYKGYYGKEEGTGKTWEVITEITGIDSVDFVTEPGARGRMMESAGADAPKENAVDFKLLTVEQLREARPDLAQMIGEAAVAAHRAHESDATEVETLRTNLTAAQQERDTARSALRDTQIAREVEVAVAAEGSGIPKAVQPDVATEVTAAVRGLPPTETEGPKLKTAVESVVKAKSELLRKVSQPPSPDVTTGKRGADAPTERSKGEGVLRSYLH